VGSGHAARELKSVHVNVPCVLLRLVVHKCHVNALNVYNQVGIVALNVLGEPLPADAPGAGPTVVGDDEIAEHDPATADLLRDLAAAKAAAVAAEDFDEAKRLRDALGAARSVAVSRASLEARKAAAIRDEDYDLAKTIKAEIAAIEASGGPAAAAAAARAGRPLPGGGLGTTRRVQVPDYAPASPARGSPGAFRGAAAVAEEADERPAARGSVVISAKGGGQGSTSWDERPAVSRATAGGGGDEDFDGAAHDGSSSPVAQARGVRGGAGNRGSLAASQSLRAAPRHLDDDPVGAAPDAPALPTHDPAAEGFSPDLPIAEPLGAVDAKDAAPLAELLGQYTVMALFSKNWQLRDAALTKVEGLLARGEPLGGESGNDAASAAAGSGGDHLRMLCRAVARALRDKVAAVALGGGKMLRPLLERYASEAGAAPRDTGGAFADVVNALADRAGDANPRLHAVAADGLQLLAAHAAVGLGLVASTLLKPQKNSAAVRPIIGRLTVLDALVAAFGAGGSTGLQVETAMQHIGKCLDSANGEVRAAAVKSAAQLAEAVGPDAVIRLLPKGLKAAMRDSVLEALGAPRPPPTQRVPVLAVMGGTASASTLNRSGSSRAPPAKAPAKPPPKGAAKPAAKAAPLAPPPPPPAEAAAPAQSRAIAALTAELRSRERELGLSHPEVAAVLTDLAALHSEEEQFEAAQPLYERALRIQERVLGAEHADTVQTLTDLAICHLDQGANERGRPLLERALALQEAALGPDHADVAAVRDVLASLDEEAAQGGAIDEGDEGGAA
jgi:centrosomal protein CEP104